MFKWHDKAGFDLKQPCLQFQMQEGEAAVSCILWMAITVDKYYDL